MHVSPCILLKPGKRAEELMHLGAATSTSSKISAASAHVDATAHKAEACSAAATSPGTANTLAAKIYEDRLKLPLQRDCLDDAAMKLKNSNARFQSLGVDMGIGKEENLRVQHIFVGFLIQRKKDQVPWIPDSTKPSRMFRVREEYTSFGQPTLGSAAIFGLFLGVGAAQLCGFLDSKKIRLCYVVNDGAVAAQLCGFLD
ncbi:hypothetical protein Pint_31637 [Pistacia integerrima]|uniref:Uncharacterized protein n=1 Tax=Pistacia integerrima TaxID=434235 RepID=A0ACC0XPI6_9ROSI|nr:hypothetical protein Pint_31637 [Pistacia integerrima]